MVTLPCKLPLVAYRLKAHLHAYYVFIPASGLFIGYLNALFYLKLFHGVSPSVIYASLFTLSITEKRDISNNSYRN
jgi:hypothetical protein